MRRHARGGYKIKTKPPRGSVAAIFLSGPTIFQASKGMMESFGRISLFPGFCPWHLLGFFGYLDSKLFFGFGWRFLHYGFSDTGSQGFRWI